MRRSERLSDLIDIVRDGRLHRARDLADQLEVSERTIYRDIDTLIANGVPIEGERGVGYLLREPVFLPPLALSITELEALSLGMSLVQEIADPELQEAAKTLHTKIASHAPNRKKTPEAWGFGLYAFEHVRRGLTHMPVLRSALRAKGKLEISYQSLDDSTSTRIIRPLQTDYWGKVWTLTSWCELRSDFRAFRVDRITSCRETGAGFQDEPGKRIEDYVARVNGEKDGGSDQTDPAISDVPRP
ncbi:MAG: YafY family protein [Pseudomonadota bacterium]